MALTISMPMALLALVALLVPSFVEAHTVLTYPGWRGNTLSQNDKFPFGMQWTYPCGGLDITKNRTFWPTAGNGAIAFQPGWFRGHSDMLMYINMGLGEVPDNYSMPMTPMFKIVGPSDGPYPGTFCLPQVELPAGVTPKNGDKATIQLVQAHKHGAATFNCVDIEFTDDKSKIPEVNVNNCFNSTDLSGFHVDVVRSGADIIAGPTMERPAPSQTSSSAGTPSPTNVPAAAGKREAGRWSGLVSFLLML